MTKSATAIRYNFDKGTFSNTNLIDGLGLELMKISAKLTKPWQYLGLSIANRCLRAVLPSNRNVEASLLSDTKFIFPYGDGYWGVLLDNSTAYSPEVENFLLGVKDVDYAFIDCGANYGYMSAIVTSDEYGSKSSIAIEADPQTFQLLKKNAKINANRFEIKNRAIFSESGIMVDMSDAKHEARSILDENGHVSSGNVETLALDDIIEWVEAQNKELVMLKLDVEGVEIDAMKGAQKLLEKDLVIFYEDHGSDTNHAVSQYLKDTLGMRIFYPDVDSCEEMRTLQDITTVKTNSRTGYDFLATNSNDWLEIITR